ESDDNNQCTINNNDDHYNTTQANSSMHIIEVQNSTTDQPESTDHHNNETEFVENPNTATEIDGDQMEIEDNTQQQDGNTIASQTTTTQATYSQIAQKNLVYQDNIQSTKQNDFTEEWTQEINKKLEQDVLETFDKSLWNYDKIVAALKTTNRIQEFIKYKMQTKPTNQALHPAIEAKFRHRDATFFLTFIRIKKSILQHQEAYENLFQEALKKYKLTNKITITDNKQET